MSLTNGSMWASALTKPSIAEIQPWLAQDVRLVEDGRVVTGPESVAAALSDAISPGADGTEIIEFGDPAVVAVRRTDPASDGVTCLVLHAGFDSHGQVATVTMLRLAPTVVPPGIERRYQAPAELLGGQHRAVADGISLHAFASAKLVTKHWGTETWLHSDAHPFGFKSITLRAGCRTSLQYHEQKNEVYFVLAGLARLHYKDGDTVATAPFLQGTVAMVRPLAWHRVEAITDVILIEASTYDDGSDNVRVEDDYGRPSGHIRAEHAE